MMLGDVSTTGVALNADGTLDYSGTTDAPPAGNPCTWWDDIYLRQPCEQYLMQNDPTNPLLVMVQQGAIAGGGSVLGNAAGQAASNFGSSFFHNLDGSFNWASLALIGALGFVGFEYLTARR